MQPVKEPNRHQVHFSNCNLVMKYKYHELDNILLQAAIDCRARLYSGVKITLSLKWAVYFFKWEKFPTYFNLFNRKQ